MCVSLHTWKFSFWHPVVGIEPTSLWSAANSLPTEQLLRVTLLKYSRSTGVRPCMQQVCTLWVCAVAAQSSLCSRSEGRQGDVSYCLQAAESGISFAQPCTLLVLPAVACLRNIGAHTFSDNATTKRALIVLTDLKGKLCEKL